MKEARHFGVTIESPDVNRSGMGFTVDYESSAIRYGLIGIDGVGEVAARQCAEKAPYETLEHFDLSHSFKYSKLNKGHRQALLEAGALDFLGARSDWSETAKAQTELKRLGMALRPGATFGDEESLIVRHTYTQDEFEAMEVGERVVLAGSISDLRNTVTKKGRNPGQQMAHVRIKFGLDEFSLTFFPPAFASSDGLLEIGRKIIVEGRKDDNDKVIVNGAMDVDEWVKDQKEKEASNFSC